jgi:hypothetical protein
MKSLLILFTLFFYVTAANYYVDTAGSDGRNGRTPETAWRTLYKASTSPAVVSGDSVRLKAGQTWTGCLQARANGVTYAPYGTGSSPRISRSGVSYGHCVEIYGNSIVVTGLELTNAHESGVRIKGKRCLVTKCDISRSGTGVMVDSQYNIIDGNHIHDLTMITSDSRPDNDYGAVGVWLNASNNEVNGNILKNCRAPSIDYLCDGGAVEIYGSGDSTRICNNWVENCEGFLEVGGSGGSAQHIRVERNTIYQDSTQSPTVCLHDYGQFSVTITDFLFRSNVVVQSSGSGWGIFECMQNRSAVSLTDNFFYSDLRIMAGEPGAHSGNIYHMVGAEIGYLTGLNEKILP